MTDFRTSVGGALKLARLLAVAFLLGFLLHFATGCSGGKDPVIQQNDAPQNNWDAMSWDDGEWALRAPAGDSEARA